jgi:hypothetical protein
MYYEGPVVGTLTNKPSKIIALTKTRFTILDGSTPYTLKRITKEEAELSGKPGEP